MDDRMWMSKKPSVNLRKFVEGIMIIVLGILVYVSVSSFIVGATTSMLLVVLGLVACIKSLRQYVADETPRGFYNAILPKPANLIVFVLLSVFIIVLGPSISPGNYDFCSGSVDLAKNVMPFFYPFAIIFSRLGFDMRVCGMFVPVLAVIHLPYWYALSCGIVSTGTLYPKAQSPIRSETTQAPQKRSRKKVR